jgi:hypothetical protein
MQFGQWKPDHLGRGPDDPGDVRMIRVCVWMIRAGRLLGCDLWEELQIKDKNKNWCNFGVGFEVEMVGNARSTCNIMNPRIKINKTSSNLQITNFLVWLFLWGIFEIGQKQQNWD